MKDYLTSDYMELVPLAERANSLNYYIPHHCILLPCSRTTKFWVVFNASARITTGISLNDRMYEGPKLQAHIQCFFVHDYGNIFLWPTSNKCIDRF